jgi:predicted dehydrogenase
MDYTQQPLLFKVRKVARYVRLYGVSRTRVKVLGQLHMKRRFAELPAQRGRPGPRQQVAVIGCGNYAFSHIAYYLQRTFGAVIGGCMDIDAHRAASMARRYRIPRYTSDAAELLDDDAIRMVFIASNHASHADYAVAALERGKHVYIEKPHVVSDAQLDALVRAMDAHPGQRVFLGFNRPGSRFGRLILEHLARDEGPGMYNWFVAGHAIEPDHWYYRPREGGRVLGNLCHWTDFVLHMAPADRFPVRIQPVRGAKSDTDIAVSYTFPDETIAVITFSAKGHTFEGVRERLSAHRGNTLILMDDYERMSIEVQERRRVYRNLYRDQGHARNIASAYRAVFEEPAADDAASRRHVADSAWLFLRTREALETDRPLEIRSYRESVAV